MKDQTVIVTIVLAVLASNGLWDFLKKVYEKISGKRSSKDQALIGLLHDRIYELGRVYLLRKSITTDEYDNFIGLYEPYVAMGGNGTGKKIKAEIDKLPIVNN